MGLFSFLTGEKKDKVTKATTSALAKAQPPMHVAPEPIKPDPAAIAIDAAPEIAETPPRRRRFELTHLKHVYADATRTGDAAKAYDAACKLASFYKSVGVRGFSADYRAAADAHFGDWLAEVSRDRRRTALAAVRRRSLQAGATHGLARTRLAVAAEKFGGSEAAKLLVAHNAFLAKLDGPRGRATA